MVDALKGAIGTNRMIIVLFAIFNNTVLGAIHAAIVYYKGSDSDLGTLLIIAIATNGTLAGAEIFKQIKELRNITSP